LAVTQKEQPTEIHLISTTTGKQKAVQHLLDSEKGQFHRLCQDYHLEGIHFNADTIHVIPDKEGRLLDDIKTPEENEALADFITQKVNELTRDDDSILYVSIAGGRKTMGYYLGYALSLFGRRQDRLSHVLVTERYESLPDFFYPTPYSHLIKDRDNQELDAKDASIMLADIPFVRLRGGIPHFLLEGKASFSDSIRFARTVETDPLLEIDGQSLSANGMSVSMKKIDFAFYVWVILETIFKEGKVMLPSSPNGDYVTSYLAVYERLFNAIELDERTEKTLSKHGMESKWMSERCNKVKAAFEKALGKSAAKAFLIESSGKNNHRHYAVKLSQQQIVGFPLAIPKK